MHDQAIITLLFLIWLLGSTITGLWYVVIIQKNFTILCHCMPELKKTAPLPVRKENFQICAFALALISTWANLLLIAMILIEIADVKRHINDNQ